MYSIFTKEKERLFTTRWLENFGVFIKEWSADFTAKMMLKNLKD